MSRFTLLALLCSLSGCAHTREQGSVEDLKPTVEAFHQRLKWRDFRGASEFLVNDRRAAFTKARLSRNDDRDLSFTDYQLEDCEIALDLKSAKCVSKLGWIRLPNPNEESAIITSKFVWDGGSWRLESQDEGPFQPELAKDEKPPPAKPSPAQPKS